MAKRAGERTAHLAANAQSAAIFFGNTHTKQRVQPRPLVIASVTKKEQYLITTFESMDRFPDLDDKENIDVKKAKGVNSAVKKSQLTFYDFEDSAVNNNSVSRKVFVASLRKVSFRVYLIRNRKRLLSNLCTKRLFSPKYRTKNHFFSWPLHLLKVIKER